MKNNKKSLITSILSMLLCIAMLIGTTYAWFTDTVQSGSNIIKSGNLDIGMYWSKNNVDWNNVEGDTATPIFNYDKWEPGYTEVRYIKITNEGSLAFSYEMLLSPNGTVEKLAEVIDVYYDVVTANASFVAPTAENKLGSLVKMGSLSEIIDNNGELGNGVLLPADATSSEYLSGEIVICFSFHMQESAGNDYQGLSIGTTFDINLFANQFDYESDSFDNSYDDESNWADNPVADNAVQVDLDLDSNNTTLTDKPFSSDDGTFKGTIFEGTKLVAGATSVTASLTYIDTDNSEANVEMAADESGASYNIHVEGLAADNTVPVEIFMAEALPTGLNASNIRFYHVENGVTVAMTPAVDANHSHNTFSYDSATGNVILYLASFSEVKLIAEPAKWEGDFDYTWYNQRSETDVYYISSADQLAAFGAIVGGMNGKTRDTFEGKTVKLMADINIGELDSENGIVFYPIGYYNSTGDYSKVSGGSVTSNVYSFKGTFDGNGYTVSNFYQNTWEMFGDYNDGYSGTPNHYKDGMGLFGYVYGGTIKNLTINNFSSDGEFTPTGVIAAYACNSTFENIAIINCNPRVYNTGNGGIVGIGGNSDDPDTYTLTFSNITIDNTNKITSLWGSWDTACGGLIGMFRGAGHVRMTNCHVGAQIDVYNDVCGNYQYYWYRYSGILIGTNKNMYTDDQGYTVPETDKFEAVGCTVHFGDWNNYYYCELVANSLASYTHDHQMSRLTEIASLSEIKSGDTWLKTGNFLLIEGDTKTCYHIVKDENGNLVQHMHENAGYEDGIDEDNDGNVDLKEDKQIVYLPFNQLFTGYGWGVKHIPIYNDETQNPFKGVKILDRKEANSVEKFEGRRLLREVTADGTVIKEGYLSSPVSGRHYKLSHIFNYLESSNVRVIPGAITVTVTNLDDDGNVTATLERDPKNWGDSTLTFSGGGRIRLTIQDYYYCTPTSIEIEVRNYPAGSKIRNFTYDGFANDHDFHFNAQADHITNGKHGIYECDFGWGPEVLDYAHKLDSKGKIVFTAPADGKFTIAFASQNVGSGIKYTVGGKSYDLDRVDDPYELHIAQVEMKAGKTYEFTRISSECGIYYVGYVPDSTATIDHTEHTYYEDNTATCETGGTLVRMCLVCGDTTTTPSKALGHTYENLDLCMVEGCRKSYDAHKNNALGHAYLNELGYHETCTDNGKKPGVYCTRCDHVESGCETITAHGHKYVDGFCRCGSHQCHQPERIDNVYKEAIFSTGNASDYSDYGTNSFFQPHGSIDMSNDKQYLIMKTDSELHNAYIEFTVAQDVTFYVKVSSTGRGNYTDFVLRKVDGTQETNINSVFHSDEATISVEGVSGHTIVYTLKAGTYRFYCTSENRVGRVMAMTVSTKVINVSQATK